VFFFLLATITGTIFRCWRVAYTCGKLHLLSPRQLPVLCSMILLAFPSLFRTFHAITTIFGALSIWLQIVLQCYLNFVLVFPSVGFDLTFISVFSTVVVSFR
jgi:hypothetical protein